MNKLNVCRIHTLMVLIAEDVHISVNMLLTVRLQT